MPVPVAGAMARPATEEELLSEEFLLALLEETENEDCEAERAWIKVEYPSHGEPERRRSQWWNLLLCLLISSLCIGCLLYTSDAADE